MGCFFHSDASVPGSAASSSAFSAAGEGGGEAGGQGGRERLEIALGAREWVLENGLRLVTAHRPELPLTSVQLYYRVGSGAEEAAWRGTSHFLEHLMFKGSAGYPEGSFDRLVEEAGGASNAYTTEDLTCYHTDLPTQNLELLLRLEADRMERLRFSATGFEAERAVILEERLETVDDDPAGAVFEALAREVYAPGHPYASPVIGTAADLERLSLEACARFYEEFYRPRNALLVIVGDLEHERARKLAAATLGRVQKGAQGRGGRRREASRRNGLERAGGGGEKAGRVNGVAGAAGGRRWIEVGNAAEAPLFAWGWRAPAAADGDAVAVELLAEILAGGESSRLERGVVRARGLALGVQAGAPWRFGESLFSLLAEGDSAARAEDLQAAVEEELQRLREVGPSAAEVRRAATRVRAMTYRQAASNGGLAELLGAAVLFHGGVDAVNDHLRRVATVTLEEVRRVAARLLDPAAGVRVRTRGRTRGDLVVLGERAQAAPAEGGEAAEGAGVQATEGRCDAATDAATGTAAAAAAAMGAEPTAGAAAESVAPALGTPGGGAGGAAAAFPALRFPPLLLGRGPGGLLLALTPDARVPLVSLRLVTAAGSALDPPGGAGLARLTADLLQLGSARYDAEAVARRVDEMGGTLSAAVGREHLSVQLDLLAEHLPAGLELLAELLLRPAFGRDHFERERALLVADARALRDRPDELCDALLWQAVFGDHSYAHPPAGRATDLAAINAAAPARFHARVVRQPARAVLGVVGDFDAGLLEQWIGQEFGAWGEAAEKVERSAAGAAGPCLRPRIHPLPTPRYAAGRRLHFLPQPGLHQCQLVIGGRGPRGDYPHKAALEIANAVLGGTFGSRLNQRLRVELGICYGVQSGPLYLSAGGLYAVSLSTRAERAVAAIEATLKLLAEFHRRPPTAIEIEAARAQLRAQTIERLQSHPGIAAETAHGLLLGLGARFREEHYQALGSASVTAVAGAAGEIPWRELQICVVGPPEVEGELRRAAGRPGIAADFELHRRAPAD